MIPILPSDPGDMAALRQRFKDDLGKESQSVQKTWAFPPADEENKHAKVAGKTKSTKKPPTEPAKSPMKATDPNKKLASTKCRGTKKRARQEDQENEVLTNTDGKKGREIQAEKVVKQQEATQAPSDASKQRRRNGGPCQNFEASKGGMA